MSRTYWTLTGILSLTLAFILPIIGIPMATILLLIVPAIAHDKRKKERKNT